MKTRTIKVFKNENGQISIADKSASPVFLHCTGGSSFVSEAYWNATIWPLLKAHGYDAYEVRKNV